MTLWPEAKGGWRRVKKSYTTTPDDKARLKCIREMLDCGGVKSSGF